MFVNYGMFKFLVNCDTEKLWSTNGEVSICDSFVFVKS